MKLTCQGDWFPLEMGLIFSFPQWKLCPLYQLRPRDRYSPSLPTWILIVGWKWKRGVSCFRIQVGWPSHSVFARKWCSAVWNTIYQNTAWFKPLGKFDSLNAVSLICPYWFLTVTIVRPHWCQLEPPEPAVGPSLSSQFLQRSRFSRAYTLMALSHTGMATCKMKLPHTYTLLIPTYFISQ